jgi:hypothetical protein
MEDTPKRKNRTKKRKKMKKRTENEIQQNLI